MLGLTNFFISWFEKLQRRATDVHGLTAINTTLQITWHDKSR
jgi:hypothetical protein